VKERAAVQVIMEQKIKVLVQSVAQAAGTLVNTSPAGNSPAGQALAKVCFLFRFIIVVLTFYYLFSSLLGHCFLATTRKCLHCCSEECCQFEYEFFQ
jgi:hypothetical protein